VAEEGNRGRLRARDAELPGPDRRGRCARAHRLSQVTSCSGVAMSVNAADSPFPTERGTHEANPKSYLDAGYGLRSWLTTHDHKRIAILYALAITAFFFTGGVAAALMRLELISPNGALMSAE